MTTKTISKNQPSEEMKKLLEKDENVKIPSVGDMVEGKVISVSKSKVYLDIDGFGVGVIRGIELFDESGDSSDLATGDKVQATVLELENENREMELSFRRAGHKKAWDHLLDLKEKQTVVPAEITEANKGGLMVQVGRVDGFLPVSQLTVEHYPRVEGGDRDKILERLNQYIRKTFDVKIIDVNEAEEKLIVSEKSAWEEKQKDVIESYKIGGIVEGKITGVADFGAFIKFGKGLEGLIHISELAWQRIDNPRDFIKVGEKVKAKIISVEDGKISLSRKQLKEDPWKRAIKKYKVGQKVKGAVLKINPFGVFVELDKDIHGLAHISELSSKKISSPEDIIEIGKKYDFKILSIESTDHRLGLSIKALGEDKPATKTASAKDKKDSSESPKK